ncbi:conserved hypothetical protein [Roseibium sp. TrichSKD4]|uniref:DUF4169 family protein n=1 Tax=Roseibium sp. TrichSKD4 TaxID=744980 RepID=UPI0001E568CD|nr:DUF4169 family protein [Roseibium sp. TrichSKD4]EFO31016.1 conserved hypothetical protein [Roseibium sp. TrichSKD4]
MTGDVINLRQARKRKARADKAEKANQNRIAFGRTKAEKNVSKKTITDLNKTVDAHHLDRTAKDEADQND